MTPRRRLWLAATLGVLIAVIGISAIVGRALRDARPDTAYYGSALMPPKTATDAVLTGANGRPAHVLDAAYPATFLFFGYTHCPDECPLALASLAKAYRGLTRAAQARTRIVFVSVDPARDTPAVMAHYLAHFGVPIAGLTGSAGELEPVWRAYGVDVDSKTREVGHGDAIYAIDFSQRVVLIYTPETPPSELLADAKLLSAAR